MTQQKAQTPRKWDKRKDSQKCIGCAKDFVKGDMIFRLTALTLHATRECVRLYREDSIELGLDDPCRLKPQPKGE